MLQQNAGVDPFIRLPLKKTRNDLHQAFVSVGKRNGGNGNHDVWMYSLRWAKRMQHIFPLWCFRVFRTHSVIQEALRAPSAETLQKRNHSLGQQQHVYPYRISERSLSRLVCHQSKRKWNGWFLFAIDERSRQRFPYQWLQYRQIQWAPPHRCCGLLSVFCASAYVFFKEPMRLKLYCCIICIPRAWIQMGERRVRYQTADYSFMLTSSLNSPNAAKLISAIAALLHNQIDADVKKPRSENPEFMVFDEDMYLEGTDAGQEKLHTCPTVEEIVDFFSALYDAAQYSAECNVLALLYINRLIAFSGLTLNKSNWRPIIFTALLIAQKVWDDKLLSNASFAFIYPFFTREEINKLEATFLDLLHFEVVNPANFLEPLSSESALALEERSRRFQQTAHQQFLEYKSMTMI
ncbi:N-terminal domain-containing protein [Cyclospora cayetanensis]|uniref:N-terminal domain-containing protein n=1 Tax=Cyclospora cayetanensis TaxID=88456 RepID=A0A1D3DAV8_9EIME|nr:N-terminal domain-containing protein [Cyclospora cayetanensis]